MIEEAAVGKLLAPFRVGLTPAQSGLLLQYLELLQRWNRKINLTAVRSEADCVTRHFGESLFVTSWMHLHGRLLDVGSGAGFPGLALKIVCPELEVTLLEPVAKKRAFLKEVARTCGMKSVEVRGERLEGFVKLIPSPTYDVVTSRAVGHLKTLLPLAVSCLRAGGHLCLWLGGEHSVERQDAGLPISWQPPVLIPISRERWIQIGTKVDAEQLR